MEFELEKLEQYARKFEGGMLYKPLEYVRRIYLNNELTKEELGMLKELERAIEEADIMLDGLSEKIRKVVSHFKERGGSE
ncbi:hypothetical protein E3E31_12430 [Thermococcus sp. M39]|uniref:hypothetical protein n=1 Tax=unclassified Thermococcus TaxID=2627626 RepID=UPI001431AC2E|nr:MULTISPECIES: hypothetical protein [unclassified Thermococcus]NJE06614.1 hypothetical protein [Thermococcus sp. M36]NJE09315.1 hypothetical protein [Thermococcus sp. M39]NJE27076.1 hypothetical protein [Thermococcus sp. MV5]NJE47837.1 hypothetical protein [Thermococcus sp. GR7]NJE55652.1 hypothetical protein [Thermococcus sp. 21S9]